MALSPDLEHFPLNPAVIARSSFGKTLALIVVVIIAIVTLLWPTRCCLHLSLRVSGLKPSCCFLEPLYTQFDAVNSLCPYSLLTLT